jgi:hypothetical protein
MGNAETNGLNIKQKKVLNIQDGVVKFSMRCREISQMHLHSMSTQLMTVAEKNGFSKQMYKVKTTIVVQRSTPCKDI